MRLVSELRRRGVFRMAVLYGVAAWVILQVADVLIDLAKLPDWIGTTTLGLLAVGFPITIVLAWAFDLTPEGFKREKDILGDGKSTAIPDIPEQSVAVLPFVNMSSDPNQEYFSDGITEEILDQLAQIRGLEVPGRTSTFAFKGKNEDLSVISAKLNVAHVLEGSVRKAGNRVRITVQLLKVSDGFHLWSKTFDRNLTDIFSIQEEIAKAVAKALSITLGVGEGELGQGGTRNFDAYDAYVAGVSLARQSGMDITVRAIEQLEKAVALDPDYAQAWSALATTYGGAADFFIAERTEELYQKADAAASRAIEIAPEAVASLQAAAEIDTHNHDWIRVEHSLETALQIAPANYQSNMQYGLLLLTLGRPKAAINSFQRAARTEPLLLSPILHLGWAYVVNTDFDMGSKQFKRCEGLIGNQMFRHISILVLGMQLGDRVLMDEALENLLTASDLPPNQRLLISTMASKLDSPDSARTELHRLYADPALALPMSRASIATWASFFGDPELALKIYRELSESSGFKMFMLWRPLEKEMRRLHGFKDYVRELGLADYWLSSGKWGDFCRPVGDEDFECR